MPLAAHGNFRTRVLFLMSQFEGGFDASIQNRLFGCYYRCSIVIAGLCLTGARHTGRSIYRVSSPYRHTSDQRELHSRALGIFPAPLRACTKSEMMEFRQKL